MKVYSIKVWKYHSRISLPFPVCGTANMDLKLQPWADIIPSTRCWIGLPLSPFLWPCQAILCAGTMGPLSSSDPDPNPQAPIPALASAGPNPREVTYAQSWVETMPVLLSCPAPGCQVLSWETLTAFLLLVQQAKYTVCLALNLESLQQKGILLKSTVQLK